MTPEQIIERLYGLGHFHNPAHPTGVTKDDLNTLRLHDNEVRKALRSYQEFMSPDFDRLSLAEHGRLGVADGDIGPATNALLDEPRCGFPDYPYPEGVMASQLNANWPTACRGKLRFGRNFKALPGLTEKQTDDVFHAMTNTWSIALEDVEITISSYQDADIYAALESLGGGTLAYSFLANNSCQFRCRQAYDSSRQWNMGIAYPVPTHEVGHALGLPHNRDNSALMYPNIHSQSIARLGWPNATDLAQAKSLGYKLSGKPAPPLADLHRPRPWQPEPPTPPDGQLRFSGNGFEAFIGDKSYGEFIITPKPRV